jgi:hypothetical protein
MTIKPAPQYQSYLLRCMETRSEDSNHPATCRFSLHDPRTGEKHHFPDLEALLAFLRGTFQDSESPKSFTKKETLS